MAAAGTAASAQAAAAATIAISPVKACYLTDETVTLSLADFTPGAAVTVWIDDAVIGFVNVDATGSFTAGYTFERMDAVKRHTLTAREDANPAVAASLPYLGTTHQIASRTDQGRPGKKVKLRGYGFLFGPQAFLHVRGHGIRTDTFLARPKAPCGTFTVRRKLVPRSAPVGKYKLQFDARKRFSKKTSPRLVYRLTVFRTFSSAASAPAFALTEAG